MCKNRECDCSTRPCPKKLSKAYLLSFKALSTGAPGDEGKVFAIGALVKDLNGNTVDHFVGRCPRTDIESAESAKHPCLRSIPETRRDFYHLVQSFSEFCEKHSGAHIVLWGAKSTEVIFIKHLVKYGLMRKEPSIIVFPFVPDDPLMFAVFNGISGTEKPDSILFIPEVTMSQFLREITPIEEALEQHADPEIVPVFVHPTHMTKQ